jgi:hypothetical protein
MTLQLLLLNSCCSLFGLRWSMYKTSLWLTRMQRKILNYSKLLVLSQSFRPASIQVWQKGVWSITNRIFWKYDYFSESILYKCDSTTSTVFGFQQRFFVQNSKLLIQTQCPEWTFFFLSFVPCCLTKSCKSYRKRHFIDLIYVYYLDR